MRHIRQITVSQSNFIQHINDRTFTRTLKLFGSCWNKIPHNTLSVSVCSSSSTSTHYWYVSVHDAPDDSNRDVASGAATLAYIHICDVYVSGSVRRLKSGLASLTASSLQQTEKYRLFPPLACGVIKKMSLSKQISSSVNEPFHSALCPHCP